ncbi:alpha/beta fold hydrolase [Nocardioides dubius]|uniref:AB hydrolase-1 domain-containing protein n=1 Tax=Nocardioides dubius TaxID=317019 RepID=A0ABP4E507_9ACTN
MGAPLQFARRLMELPAAPVPPGEMIELPGRGGATYVSDNPGPTPDAPVVVLLHALATTGLLTWYPAVGELSKRYRVITLDQRSHGRGITQGTFSLYDCADDVAALLDVLGLEKALIAGYSMGSIVAQRVWRQHRERVTGLVLAASTDRFMTTTTERLFHQATGAAMLGFQRPITNRIADFGARRTAAGLGGDADLYEWALEEMRRTSPLAVGQAVAALGRHHSRPWVSRIDVPTAVVIPTKDRVIPPQRQFDLAARIPGATVHEVAAGHAAVVLQADEFVPVFAQALNTVQARVRA